MEKLLGVVPDRRGELFAPDDSCQLRPPPRLLFLLHLAGSSTSALPTPLPPAPASWLSRSRGRSARPHLAGSVGLLLSPRRTRASLGEAGIIMLIWLLNPVIHLHRHLYFQKKRTHHRLVQEVEQGTPCWSCCRRKSKRGACCHRSCCRRALPCGSSGELLSMPVGLVCRG